MHVSVGVLLLTITIGLCALSVVTDQLIAYMPLILDKCVSIIHMSCPVCVVVTVYMRLCSPIAYHVIVRNYCGCREGGGEKGMLISLVSVTVTSGWCVNGGGGEEGGGREGGRERKGEGEEGREREGGGGREGGRERKGERGREGGRGRREGGGEGGGIKEREEEEERREVGEKKGGWEDMLGIVRSAAPLHSVHSIWVLSQQHNTTCSYFL